MTPMEQARALFEQALDHHRQHRLEAAERLYRQALELVPDRVSLLVNLSAVLIAQGRTGEAAPLSERALAIEPGHPDAVEHLAACRQAGLSPEAQLARIDAELEQRPDDAGLHNHRGLLLHDLGRYAEARTAFGQALALDPGNPGTLANRGRSLDALGEPEHAVDDYRQALRHAPDHAQAGPGFINAVLAGKHLPLTPDPEFETLLARAMEAPWARPQSIAPAVQAWLGRSPVLGPSLTPGAPLPPAALPPVIPAAICDALAASRPLIALLRHAVVTDPQLEQLLARLRATLLATALQDPTQQPPEAAQALHCALAMQCFLNEYVYASAAHEQEAARGLASRLSSALERGEPVPWRWITAVACYLPLHLLPGSARLLQRQWPAAVAQVLRVQLANPLREQQLAASLSAITPIRDAVSLQVRAQYEQNPYPRWASLPRHTMRVGLREFLASRVAGPLPTTLPGDDGRPLDALNAGCGTGQHPIDMLQRIRGLRLLAVDLSRASLAYAQRKAADLQIQDIRFAQADILELGGIGRSFDLIESTGVLHHLADPARGLAVLRGLLRDGGVMRLALYSEHARRSVAACRRHIAERGYRPTGDDIRRCRTELMALAPSDPRREVMKFTDFYSMSECRDLLFHVQEHRFTLPALAALLARMSLRFVGFELAQDKVADFRRSFPDPAALGDLTAWDAHEQRNPDLFAGMYVFWVTRSAGPSAP